MRCTKTVMRLGGAMLALLGAGVAGAQENVPASACDAQRPALNFNRWSENWSALAAPCLPRQPLDNLKYLPLGEGGSYLSLGAGLRERYEHIATPLFGAGSARPDGYLIQRANLHADLRLGPYVQVFGQLVDARAFRSTRWRRRTRTSLTWSSCSPPWPCRPTMAPSSCAWAARKWPSTCSALSPRATAPMCASRSMASGPTGNMVPGV